jgi:phospholipid/cholesterol/gamma-HCH transport system substrate-binding protein
MTRRIPLPDRQLASGLALAALVVALIAATIAQYNGAFSRKVRVSVDADRAGLTMTSGTPVKLYGVEVGAVGDIVSRGDRVRIELELDPDEVDSVPRDVSAQLLPPTAFGAKYVQLSVARGSAGKPIREGDVIPASSTTVEVDEAFTNLTKVLDAARPAEVSSALSAMATAVDERGQSIGELISLTDDYLTSFNPALPTLSEDLAKTADVAGIYADARKDLVQTFDGTGTTLNTVVEQQASLRALELSLTSLSSRGDVLLKDSEKGLESSLRLLAPVTETLARYSPELPCLVLGLASGNELAERAVGGVNPGITTFTHLVRSRDPYSYPKDVKVLGENSGPGCYGLPYVTPGEAGLSYRPTFETGVNPYKEDQSEPLGRTDMLRLLGLEGVQ